MGSYLPYTRKDLAIGAHATFDVRHRADRRPVFAEFVDGDVFAQAFPNMVGRHALAHNIGVVSGKAALKPPALTAGSCMRVMYPTEEPRLVPSMPRRL